MLGIFRFGEGTTLANRELTQPCGFRRATMTVAIRLTTRRFSCFVKEFDMHVLAYLDPGTGSFLLQVLAGGMFGGIFLIKRFWGQLKGLVSRRQSTTE
ncbi:MAG TPA: hypothetical protein VIM11_18715 [Tepidisphaeraceae bacterium]|jgi:hypothetical protein